MVAEACLGFGAHLLRVRLSSVTPSEAQDSARDLFQWFASHDGFEEGSATVAVECAAFGKALLEFRSTATVREALDAIQGLFTDMTA